MHQYASDAGQGAFDLTCLPLLGTCQSVDLAKLFPFVGMLKLKQGDSIFHQGDIAQAMYFIVSGTVKLSSEQYVGSTIAEGFIGEEAAAGMDKYSANVVACNDCVLLTFPAKPLQKLLKTNPEVKQKLNTALLSHYIPMDLGAKQIENQPISGTDVTNITDRAVQKRFISIHGIGWISAILVPLIALLLSAHAKMSWGIQIFNTIFTSSIMMWIFRLSPEFVPCILSLLVLVILGVAPTSVVLSGFSSGSYFMALSIFGLGSVLVMSGITFRLVLILLRSVPCSRFWYEMVLFFTGLVSTPIIPSANGRMTLALPLLSDIADVSGYKQGGLASTSLTAATFSGFTLFSSSFISSKSVNFLVFGLLPTQFRDQFTSMHWAYSASISAVVMLLMHLVVTKIFFANNEMPKLTSTQISQQLEILGPMRRDEWIALSCVILLAIGMVTTTIHKIDTPWIGLGVLYVLLTAGVLSNDRFRRDIDWSFLIYLGGLMGLTETMSYIGVDKWMAKQFVWMIPLLKNNFIVFTLILTISIYISRLAIPNNAVVAIFCTILMPLAQDCGINPWVIGFTILTLSDGWFLPYQCTYYLPLADMAKKNCLFNERRMLLYNVTSNFMRLAGILASIPFWHALRMI